MGRACAGKGTVGQRACLVSGVDGFQDKPVSHQLACICWAALRCLERPCTRHSAWGLICNAQTPQLPLAPWNHFKNRGEASSIHRSLN